MVNINRTKKPENLCRYASDFLAFKMKYLDYSSLNDDGEPCVITARFNGSAYQAEETIAEDFGNFVLQLVKEQLEG